LLVAGFSAWAALNATLVNNMDISAMVRGMGDLRRTYVFVCK